MGAQASVSEAQAGRAVDAVFSATDDALVAQAMFWRLDSSRVSRPYSTLATSVLAKSSPMYSNGQSFVFATS